MDTNTKKRLVSSGNKQAMKYSDVSLPTGQLMPVLCKIWRCGKSRKI